MNYEGRMRLHTLLLPALLGLYGCDGGMKVVVPDSGPPLDSAGCPTAGNGDLDVVGLSVGGLVLPQYYSAVSAVLGAGSCSTATNKSTCVWAAVGQTWTFTDCDEDGVPDAQGVCDIPNQDARLVPPYNGRTADGLGLGVSPACWESALGTPTSTPGNSDVWTWNTSMGVSVGFSGSGAETIDLGWAMDG